MIGGVQSKMYYMLTIVHRFVFCFSNPFILGTVRPFCPHRDSSSLVIMCQGTLRRTFGQTSVVHHAKGLHGLRRNGCWKCEFESVLWEDRIRMIFEAVGTLGLSFVKSQPFGKPSGPLTLQEVQVCGCLGHDSDGGHLYSHSFGAASLQK